MLHCLHTAHTFYITQFWSLLHKGVHWIEFTLAQTCRRREPNLKRSGLFTGKNENIFNLLTRCWYFTFIGLLQEWKCGFSPLILSRLLKFWMLTLYNTAKKKKVTLTLFLDCSALGINISLCSTVQVFRERFPIRVMSPLSMATMQQFMGRLQILIKFLQP